MSNKEWIVRFLKVKFSVICGLLNEVEVIILLIEFKKRIHSNSLNHLFSPLSGLFIF
jgi:hypothetical protein